MMIDIVKNYRTYSPEELRDKAYSGHLECNGHDLSSFLEYFCQGLFSEEEAEKREEEAYNRGKWENDDSTTKYLIRKAIGILEEGICD